MALALFGAVGMGIGIASVMRTPRRGEWQSTRAKVHRCKPRNVVVARRRGHTLTSGVHAPAPVKETVDTRRTPPVAGADTNIVERMLANEKRLGDALYVLRRDLKAFYDTMDMRMARMESAGGSARSARAPVERVEKSVVARRALEGYLNR